MRSVQVNPNILPLKGLKWRAQDTWLRTLVVFDKKLKRKIAITFIEHPLCLINLFMSGESKERKRGYVFQNFFMIGK